MNQRLLQLVGGRRTTAPRANPGHGGRTELDKPIPVGVNGTKEPVAQPKTDPLSAGEIAVNLERLQEDITKAMPEITLDKSCHYLPEKRLLEMVTRERIKSILPDAIDDLVDFILEDGLRLFVVAVNSLSIASHIMEAMRVFQTHGLHDEDLPIEEIDTVCKAIPTSEGPSSDTADCSHDNKMDAFHHYPWTWKNRRSFCTEQWGVLVPRLTMNQFEKFETNRILPITQKNARSVGGGHFSQVFKAKLLAEYQDSHEQKDGHITIAIKEMKNLEELSYNVEKEWKREAEAMKELNRLGHPHITCALAAFKQNDKYYLILEWADGGSLRDFWLANPKPQVTEDKCKEFIVQLWGLADALDQIHNSNMRTASEAPSPVLSGISSPSATPILQINGVDHVDDSFVSNRGADSRQSKKVPDIPFINEPPRDPESQRSSMSGPTDNWRHGDLKPDNILVFKQPNTWIGTLKLADLGRAKKHQFLTHIRKVATDEKWSTRQYEPPEAFIASRQARSRLWDIWSMGCIMFESVLWLLYGDEVKHNFATETTQDTPIGTIYWTPDSMLINAKTARVNELTTNCILEMIKNDPECGPDTAIGDLLRLIKDQLLVVKLPSAGPRDFEFGCRANATELLHRLTVIRDRALSTPTYVLSGKSRVGMRAPISHRQAVAPSNKLPSAANSSTLRRDSMLEKSTHSKPLGVPSRKHDRWDYIRDESFAKQALEQQDLSTYTHNSDNTDAFLCRTCQALDFYSPEFRITSRLSELQAKTSRCSLCNLLFKVAIARYGPEDADVEFERHQSGLRLNRSGPPVLSICRTVEIPRLVGLEDPIKLGLPTLPEAGSFAHFQILRHWLQDCDNHHGQKNLNCASQTTFILPTRLLDVGIDNASPTVRLLKKDTLKAIVEDSGLNTLQYAAFSHPWGKVEKGQKHFVANQDNLEEFSTTGILLENLPSTFKDAIRIVRGLGIQYLWIDSLCILQGPKGDFDEESKLMDAVFHSAYCVIAAASATGTSSEVITRSMPKIPVIIAAVKNGKKHPLFIREPLEDFQRDVLDGPLSKRGWVLQERALARRTIFFTNKQVYMECVDGIRCETLVKMKNSEVAFLGDSNFPKYALESSKGGQIFLYESLYSQYSTLDFSYAADRSVALLGLEQRLARAFSDHAEHGIFKKHLERGLMWKRGLNGCGEPVKKLMRIKQKVTGHDRGRSSPSWSWMAYEGGIGFVKVEGGSLDWESGSKKLEWLIGDGKGNMRLRGVGRDFELPGPNDVDKADIIWDYGDEPQTATLKCVVFGSTKDREEPVVAKKRHYVLIIAKQQPVLGSREVVYERVGVGILLGSCINLEKEDVTII